jgi:serine-type D-Ala-D-Ala carboxypeptidase (penicillin-binding protein 5/6)
MRTSPLIDPSRARPTPRADGRRRRALPVLALLLALGALAAIGLAAGLFGGHTSRVRSASLSPSSTGRQGASAPARSPSGLPLGRAPLTLVGVGATQPDPLQVRFRSPPRGGLLFNLDTGAVLWQRNPLARLRIASLNKMMTALIGVRAEPPGAAVLVTKEAIDAPGSKVGILPRGHHVRFETMLYGLLLPSGNDAAVAIAQRVAGSVSAFVARMNREAARMGLACTHFSSPSGFVDQGNFSCAADLAVLAHADLALPRVARVVRTLSAVLPFPIKGGRLYLYNHNPLLVNRYPGITGLKTGFTEASGKCFVATAERRGVRLGVVLLHSPSPATQARRLLDDAFERVYGQPAVPEPPLPPGV